MPVENPTYIDGLEPDWPLGSDPESAGDDHLRLIKKATQNTFPNINAAVSGTPTQLNNLTGGIAYFAADASNILPAYWKMTDPADNEDHAAVSFLTPTLQQLTAHITLGVNWSILQNTIWRVGCVVFNADGVNPATYLGFGTWVAVTGLVAGVGSATGTYDTMSYVYHAGAGGGGIIHQEHLATITVTPTASFVGAAVPPHVHTISSYDPGGNNTSIAAAQADGNATTNTTSSSGGHTPAGTVTVNSFSIGTGSTSYSPIYNGLYVWKRTA